jgi:starch-binding outer membrane protein, SusD/RagB family
MKTKERNKMKRTLFHISILVGLAMAFLSQSCTNLDEKLYGNVSADNFPKTAEEFISTLGAAYTSLSGYGSGDIMSLQEVTTDEMVVPTRGQDWDDGGNWRRLHLHSWKYEDGATGGAWDFCYGGVSTCNRLIYQYQTLAAEGQVTQATADAYIAELSALRGWFYWQLIDLYGNVPLVTDFVTAPAAPATVQRKDVYDFIVSDIIAALPKLSKAVDGTTYGRMNYYAAWMLLAKMYLNAEVYTGTPQWDKAIAACDTLINSGKYSIESNYFANFNVNNSGSKEFIFAIPYDKIYYKGWNLPMQTLHYGSQYTYNLTAQPWNGFCSLEEFYNSYDDADLRKGEPGTLVKPSSKRGNFIAGYQWAIGGGLVTDVGGATDPDGINLNLGSIGDGVPQINEVGPNAFRQAGVRIGKWEFEIGGTENMSNDLAIFRYSDVLLMKAEALWRKSNSATDAQALALVNVIRERAGVPDLTTLDGKLSFDLAGSSVAGGELLNEMGREMFAERNRRQDLIRFGLWEQNAKWALTDNVPDDALMSDSYRRLFPINKAKKAANPNLVQNPGY